jgi:pimeloyl-ACP methyl ester carboxylesterase
MKPETRYARSGDVNIAYQVVGDGPRDLVVVPGWASNIEVFWEEPTVERFFGRLASFARLILFDKRGTGLSDRVADLPNLETRMDDVRAVLDAVGSTRAALFGYSEGGAMCALFAATYPERTSALILVGSFARRTWAPDHPMGPRPEEYGRFIEDVVSGWGGTLGVKYRAPSMANEPHFRDWWGRFLRMSASPGAMKALLRMNGEIDIRGILPAIRVPTLIVHNAGDRVISADCSRYMAERIPGAKYVELPGDDHIPHAGNAEAILDEIEEFMTGTRRGPEPDRVLATVLFTDIVDATRRVAEIGDHRWRDVLDAHHALVRDQLTRHRGQRSTPPATDFSPRSMARRAACAPPSPSPPVPGGSVSTSAPGCTPGNARRWAPSWAGSRCTSAPGSRPWPAPARCSSRAPSRAWWPGPA